MLNNLKMLVMEQAQPALAKDVLEDLAAAINSLDKVLQMNLSSLEVCDSWSNIPRVEDHVQFLRDQVAGLSAALRIIPMKNAQ